MTPRSFFKIFIKILGVYLLIDFLSVIPQFISTLSYITQDGNWQGIISSSIASILILVIYFIIFRLLIIKTDWVIDKLALDKNFDEDKFEINLHRSTVLSIAVIVIGGLIFIDTFPILCKQIFIYFQEKRISDTFVEKATNRWIIFYAVKTFLGMLLMIYQRTIVNFIELRRKRI